MPAKDDERRLLTVGEVAELLRCSVPTVRARIREGDLPAIREGGRLLVAAHEFDAYLRRLSAASEGAAHEGA